jgi:hypothetical protein
VGTPGTSKYAAEDLAEYEQSRPVLHDLGACEMKHGMRVSIVNLYADQLGNRQLQKEFQALKAAAVSNRLPMRFSTFTLLLALCCGLANGCSGGVTRRTAATVLSVKGNVVFGMAEQNNFQPVTRESRIYDGNIVRTSDGALLNLGLIAAALAQMSSNSEIKIEELKIAKDGNQTGGNMRSRSARIRLNRGKITLLFSGRDKSTSQFAVSTPAVTVTADSDCLLRVQRDDTTTRVTCVQGKVYASTGAQPPIAIGAGYFQQWPSTRPEPVAATEDAAAQIDITDSLEIENQLRELGADWQNRRPF